MYQFIQEVHISKVTDFQLKSNKQTKIASIQETGNHVYLLLLLFFFSFLEPSSSGVFGSGLFSGLNDWSLQRWKYREQIKNNSELNQEYKGNTFDKTIRYDSIIA